MCVCVVCSECGVYVFLVFLYTHPVSDVCSDTFMIFFLLVQAEIQKCEHKFGERKCSASLLNLHLEMMYPW